MTRKITRPQLDGRRSTAELLNAHDLFGIPHFQRGSVWDVDEVALLLESLYYGTPCGTIILWQPARVGQHGIALARSSQYLIIDGQQRIRSLSRVVGNGTADKSSGPNEGAADHSADLADEVDKDSRIWCLNLGKVPELASTFEGGKRYQLFRYAKDPRDKTDSERESLRGAPKQDQDALLPLNWFVDKESATFRRLIRKDGHAAIAKQIGAVMNNASVNDRLRGMLSRNLFDVTVLGPECTLQDVVDVFNRINSAGKRVEAEERAFANLVAVCPEAERFLARFFENVFPDQPGHARGELKRDSLLQRQRENRFGFKLFMRVFVMALSYHANRAVGSSSLSFDSANTELLGEARDHLPSILGRPSSCSPARPRSCEAGYSATISECFPRPPRCGLCSNC